ncbi:MAG: class I SAM-dependent methyltransferase [Candidatus Peribacter sp.]|nr:class I SAM-dependent methyltransferase [Candidatus Peribacter sp.]
MKEQERPSLVYDLHATRHRNVGCPLCNNGNARVRFEERPYQVMQCNNCSLVYVTPQRDPVSLLKDLYETGIWNSTFPRYSGYACYTAENENLLKTFRRRIVPFTAIVQKPGKALDIGCATGCFLRVLQDDYHWDAIGLEPSAYIGEFGRKMNQVRILTGTLDSIHFTPHSFDLISLWDVIEHIPDPIQFLQSIHSLLKPEGQLLIETQDIDTLFARLMGRKWHHFKHAEHLWHFSRKTMDLLLRKSGFSIASISHKHAGKYVGYDFCIERTKRISPLVSFLVSAGKYIFRKPLYFNFFDEMVVRAIPLRNRN